MAYLAWHIFQFLFATFTVGLSLGFWLWGTRLSKTQAEVKEITQTVNPNLELQKDLEKAQEQIKTQDLEKETLREELEIAQKANEAQGLSYNAALADNEKLKKELASSQKAQDETSHNYSLSQSEISQLKVEIRSLEEALQAASSKVIVPDDLIVIKGIGPKLISKINAYGIFTFSQLAQLSDAEALQLGKSFGAFEHRVISEKWREQAKELMK